MTINWYSAGGGRVEKLQLRRMNTKSFGVPNLAPPGYAALEAIRFVQHSNSMDWGAATGVGI